MDMSIGIIVRMYIQFKKKTFVSKGATLVSTKCKRDYKINPYYLSKLMLFLTNVYIYNN